MIKMIGIDFTTASLDIRSAIAIKKSELERLVERLKKSLALKGIVILNTCNRLEIWISGDVDAEELLQEFCALKNIEAEEYRRYFKVRDEEEAISHLMWLTCGLKSAIIAEDQILTQVKQAIDFARQNRFCDSTLDVLFRTAITAAKRVKTEVVFSRANASAIDQALHLLRDSGKELTHMKCLVIGNGEYGRLVANTLVANGADVTVTIRQYHSGEVLIPKGCKTILYGERYQVLPECQLVVSATASPNYTLKYEAVKQSIQENQMFLLDLAVPRDIEPKISELPQCQLYNIDDFQSQLSPDNEQALLQAEQIIHQHIAEFRNWYDYREVVPLIAQIRSRAVKDMGLRLEKPMRRLSVEEKEKEILLQQMEDAAGKVFANLFYQMRDVLEEEEFKKCVKAVWEYGNE